MNFQAFGHDEPDSCFALIREKDAAKYLDVSVYTLRALRCRGGGPKYIRISSRCIRYRRVDLNEWVVARLCNSTSDLSYNDSTNQF